MATTTAGTRADAALAAAHEAPAGAKAAIPRGLLLGFLTVWTVIGLAVVGVIVFGGYDGRPVEDLSAMNPIRHHTIFGPVFLGWTALSVILIPRTLLALFRHD